MKGKRIISGPRARVLVAFLGVAGATLLLVRCSSNSPAPGVGTSVVSVSDPPSCTNLSSVFVTIADVSGHTSTSADVTSPGWQTLVASLGSSGGKTNAVQVDLLHLPQTGQCLLAQLGSNSSLPVGDYQQIRLKLLGNGTDPATVNLLTPNPAIGGVQTSSTNACAVLGSNVWNCVALPTSTPPAGCAQTTLNGNSVALCPLQLPSEAQTGLKIPPGQIEGGPIHVAQGQSVDIDLDFDACRSVLQTGAGNFLLKPALVGRVVSPNLTGISGQVLLGQLTQTTPPTVVTTSTPFSGALVMLETAGSGGHDVPSAQMRTDTGGNFTFCPLATGTVYDLVVDGVDSSGVGYNATVALNVPNGTSLKIPLLAETGSTNGPAIVTGQVTATGNAGTITVGLQPLQAVSSTQSVVIPLLNLSGLSSTGSVAVTVNGSATNYTLIVPASNPVIGSFTSGSITFAAPAGSPVNFSLLATPSGGNCTTPQTAGPFAVTGSTPGSIGSTTTGPTITFSGC